MELLTDPNGVQKLSKVATELDFKVRNPVELKKVLSSVMDAIPANVYIGLQNSEDE
jgi:hypothetical protein